MTRISEPRAEPEFAESLRVAALIAVAVGGIGSLALMLLVGRNAPRLLLILFADWVACRLSPC